MCIEEHLRSFSVVLIVACLWTSLCAGQPATSILIGSLLPKEGGSGSVDASPLSSPFGIDFDASGNMYIVELEGGMVHSYSPEGKLVKISGDGTKSYSGDGGPAANATFNGMHNTAVTPAGDVYIADSWNHRIRRIDSRTGIITTIAGTGRPGFSGDGGPAKEAEFNYIMCISLSQLNDKIYVADLKNLRIRVIDLKTNLVKTIAGNGTKDVPAEGGVAISSPLVDPRAVAVDSKGQVYILERSGHALRVVKPDGKIYTVAGDGTPGDRSGPALRAQLNSPKHLCVDDSDNVFIADDRNGLIRRYDPRRKTLTSVMGNGIGVPPLYLKNPHGVCYENGKLYVVDTRHNRILRIDRMD